MNALAAVRQRYSKDGGCIRHHQKPLLPISQERGEFLKNPPVVGPQRMPGKYVRRLAQEGVLSSPHEPIKEPVRRNRQPKRHPPFVASKLAARCILECGHCATPIGMAAMRKRFTLHPTRNLHDISVGFGDARRYLWPDVSSVENY